MGQQFSSDQLTGDSSAAHSLAIAVPCNSTTTESKPLAIASLATSECICWLLANFAALPAVDAAAAAAVAVVVLKAPRPLELCLLGHLAENHLELQESLTKDLQETMYITRKLQCTCIIMQAASQTFLCQAAPGRLVCVADTAQAQSLT